MNPPAISERTERLGQAGEREIAISVVVPTFKRLRSLERTLESLGTQTCSEFEVLVVDNAAEEPTRQLVSDLMHAVDAPVRYLAEPELGLHNARHRGVREARGEILVFTDDDATFAPDWLTAYARAFDDHPEMAAAGGPVAAVWDAPPPRWLTEFMGDGDWFPALSLMSKGDRFSLSAEGIFFGVNMAVRREVMFSLGGFNPESYGDVWLGDGETGLNRKLWEAGMPVGYCPEARVYHHVPKERMTRKYLTRRMANEGACTEYARFRGQEPSRRALLVRLASIAYGLTRLTLGGFADLLLPQRRFGALRYRLNVACFISRAQYVLRLLHDADLRRLVSVSSWLETAEPIRAEN